MKGIVQRIQYKGFKGIQASLWSFFFAFPKLLAFLQVIKTEFQKMRENIFATG